MRKIKLRNAPQVKRDNSQDSNPGCIAFKVSVSPDQQLKDQKSPSNSAKVRVSDKAGGLRMVKSWSLATGCWLSNLGYILTEHGFFKSTVVTLHNLYKSQMFRSQANINHMQSLTCYRETSYMKLEVKWMVFLFKMFLVSFQSSIKLVFRIRKWPVPKHKAFVRAGEASLGP